MFSTKKQRLLSPFVRVEPSSSGVLEDTEILPSSSSSTSEEMVTNLHHDIRTRKFLPCWKYLFPLVEVQDGELNEEIIEKLYCRECRAAGLKNYFALGKVRPAKGWKREYLRRHDDSSNYSRIAPQVTAIAKTASSMFKAPKTSASERERLGLLINIHFLATNGLSMNKGAPLHSLVDIHILFHDVEPVIIEDDLEEVSSLSTTASTWLSKTHRSTYSTWEFVHALNAVTESEDVAKLQKARYFSYCYVDESMTFRVPNILCLLSIFG